MALPPHMMRLRDFAEYADMHPEQEMLAELVRRVDLVRATVRRRLEDPKDWSERERLEAALEALS